MYDLITSFVEPMPLLFSCSGLAIANLWRRRRESRTRLLFVLIPFCVLWFACTTGVAHLALGTLEWRYPADASRPPNAKAIVVLSGLGNVDPNLGGSPHELLGEITVGRCLYAAELYRKAQPCPMVVSGGNVKPSPPGPTPAEVMRDFLIGQGVGKEHIIVEDHSRTTYENAVASADLLKASNVVEIVLVTDASHLYRATRCFRRQGLTVHPLGCRYRTSSFRVDWSYLLPNPEAAQEVHDAVHEWLGVLWYWLRGRI